MRNRPDTTRSPQARPSRREFLDFSVGGLGAAALWSLLERDAARASDAIRSPSELPSHRSQPPRAKRVVHICLVGGLSQVDTFDYKPTLEKLNGKPPPKFVEPDSFFGSQGLLKKNEWGFLRHGESGLWVSDLFPHLASVADDLTVIHSMHSETGNHTPAMFLQNSGFATNGFPSLGSWLSYGLGNETESLPTFVVLPDARSLPNSGAANWTSGFLLARHQGTVFRSGQQPVRHLFAKQEISAEAERDARSLLRTIQEKHLRALGDDDFLRAPHPGLRAVGAHADVGAGSHQLRGRTRVREVPLRSRPRSLGRLRPDAASSRVACSSVACDSSRCSPVERSADHRGTVGTATKTTIPTTRARLG